MGSCYSRKAGGGNYTYSTVPMASTKLEDPSRLARPTPYARNTSTGSLLSRKGIPIPTKNEHSPRMSRHVNNMSDLKNVKNSHIQYQQSSIPRFNSNSSSIPIKTEMNENILNANHVKNDNTQFHLVNNNIVSSTPSATECQESNGKSAHPKQISKSNLSSKMNPENIPMKSDEKYLSRIPAKVSYLPTPPRSQFQSVLKSPQAISHANTVLTSATGRQASSGNDISSLSNLVTDSDETKISCTTSESQCSIIDSGLGNSLSEKLKQEDSDTLKDVERLENCDISPIHVPQKKISSPEDSKSCKPTKFESTKQNSKYSMYKREINGKWTVEEKCRNEEKQSSPQSNGENIFKISMSQSFPTYASYKNHISYKKYSQNHVIETSSHMSSSKLKNDANVYHSSHHGNLVVGETDNLRNKSPCENEAIKSSQLPLSPKSDSDEKSDGIGSDSKSPVSEIENREFLIDDEISDQPELVCSFVNGKMSESPVPSLQQSVTELHALQMSSSTKRNDTSTKSRQDRIGSDNRDSMVLSSELGSSCSSIASDDLMMDFEKKMDFPDGTINEGMASPMRKISDVQAIEDQLSSLGIGKSSKYEFEDKTRKRLHRRASGPYMSSGSTGKDEWRLRSISLPLRPPRAMSVLEADDGSIILDSSSYRLLSQDLNSVKTLLLRLKSVIQEAETINPFDQNIFYQSLVHSDFPLGSTTTPVSEQGAETPQSKSQQLSIENADLRRQIVLLQQQLEEKDRTVHLLQQQMTKYTNLPRYDDDVVQSHNAATQTERPRCLTSSLAPSLNNSSETLVSKEQDSFEEMLDENEKGSKLFYEAK